MTVNGHAAERRISTELEKRVKDFCDKVGYVPNINAKRASSKYVENVGFLINQNLLSTGHNPFSDQNTSEITGDVCAAWGGGSEYTVKDSFTTNDQFDYMVKVPDNVTDVQAVLAYNYNDLCTLCRLQGTGFAVDFRGQIRHKQAANRNLSVSKCKEAFEYLDEKGADCFKIIFDWST